MDIRRMLCAAIGGCIVTACGSGQDGARHASASAARAAVADPDRAGPYAVGHTSFMLHDQNQRYEGDDAPNRPIPVSVWYPADPGSINATTPGAVYVMDPLNGAVAPTTSADWEPYGIDRAYEEPPPSSRAPFPLLVFSPGWGAPTFAHTSIGARLASHGFVVAVMYHFGDAWWPWERFEPSVAAAAFNRSRDVSFVLTDLLQRNGRAGELLHGTIRPDQVAAGGWSLGGYAAQVLAGGDDSVCDLLDFDWSPAPPWTCAPSLPDPRIRAIAPLDGSNQALHFSELARIQVPALDVGEEWNTLWQMDPAMASWQARAHAAYSGNPAYRVDVAFAIHQSFSDLCEVGHVLVDKDIDPGFGGFLIDFVCNPGITSAEAHRITAKYAIAFLKTNLAGEAGYQNILTPGYALTREPMAEFFVTEKRSPSSITAEWPGDFTYFMHQPGSAHAQAAKDGALPALSRAVPGR